MKRPSQEHRPEEPGLEAWRKEIQGLQAVGALKTQHLMGCQSQCRRGGKRFACGPELCSFLGGYCQAQRKGYELLSGVTKEGFVLDSLGS